MFTDAQLQKYAQVLMWGMKKSRGKPFKPGNFILLKTDLSALPLARVVNRYILDAGMIPVLRMAAPEGMEKDFFALADNDQLKARIPGDEDLYNHLDGAISLLAPESLTHMQDIDPSKIAVWGMNRKYLRDIMNYREARGDFGWTLCLYPTPELAEKAGMSIDEYTQEVVQAVYLNDYDPAFLWERLYEMSSRIKKWLDSLEIKFLHIHSENTDLWVDPGKERNWLGVSGQNIPSFEIFISPDWRGTSGVYFADQPSFRNGNIVNGVQLEFKNGQVQKVRAEKGEDFVRSQVEMDEGASRLGEFSLTDRRMSRIKRFMAHTLYDENFGGEYGNCHVALGAAYPESFAGDASSLDEEEKRKRGFNDSALHWDLVNTENKKVYALLGSGEKLLIYTDGEFQLDGV